MVKRDRGGSLRGQVGACTNSGRKEAEVTPTSRVKGGAGGGGEGEGWGGTSDDAGEE